MTRGVYSRQELMTLLGYKCPKSFRARLPALYAIGFPLPLPLRGAGKWSAAQVDHWLATGGRTPILERAAPAAQTVTPSKVTNLDAARARLAIQANRF
jgi:hypothetical protein